MEHSPEEPFGPLHAASCSIPAIACAHGEIMAEHQSWVKKKMKNKFHAICGKNLIWHRNCYGDVALTLSRVVRRDAPPELTLGAVAWKIAAQEVRGACERKKIMRLA